MMKVIISILVLWAIIVLFVLGRPAPVAEAGSKSYRANGIASSGKWYPLSQ